MTSNQETFPLVSRDGFNGMVISLPGVIVRAAECCERSEDTQHLGYMLRKLREHIDMLRESPNDAEAVRRLGNFLTLWTD